MPRQVIWAPKATKDFLAAIDFMEADSAINASRVANRVVKRIESLAQNAIGRPGRVSGTYEASIPHTSLIIAFELPDKSKLHILRIIHMRRNWRTDEWPE
jgi:toxin ParE1/3/4